MSEMLAAAFAKNFAISWAIALLIAWLIDLITTYWLG